MHLGEFGHVSLVQPLDVAAETNQQALSDFDLLRSADNGSQEFSQAARGGVGCDAVGGLISQRQSLQFWQLVL